MARASWMTRPAIVVASSSGNSQSIARLRSRIGTAPSTIDRAVLLQAHTLHREIMFVADVADDLLENVLQRHEAHDLAVFVDDEGEMRLALQESLSWSSRVVASGTNQGFSTMLSMSSCSSVAPRRIERAQQILGVQHADDVVGSLAPDRHARIGRRDHLADQFAAAADRR